MPQVVYTCISCICALILLCEYSQYLRSLTFREPLKKMAQVNGPLLEASKSVKNIYKLKKKEKKKKRELDD